MRSLPPLLAVCGTRPEAVKLGPVVHALRAAGNRVVVVLSGQHPDLAPAMLAEAGLTPDACLAPNIAGTPPAQLLGGIIAALGPLLVAHRPALVLVQGDTVSALAGALAAAYAQVPVAHVEAGLRTGDDGEPHPEEMHRRLIAPVTRLHFAPTARAVEALRQEGIAPDRIHLVGNTAIDALHRTCARLADPRLASRIRAAHPDFEAPGPPRLLVTCHRRENQGPRLAAVAEALARLAAAGEARILVPLHPSPAAQRPFRQALGGVAGARLVPAVDHATMVWLLQRSALLLTDSGGLQEEAPSLGLRTLVLRAATERPEAIEVGAAELAPLEADGLVASVRRALARPPMAPVHPFGVGDSGARIAALIGGWLGVCAQAPARLRKGLRPRARPALP